MKKIVLLLVFLFSITFTTTTYATNNNFITVVNPVRGNDFWSIKEQQIETVVSGQMHILDKLGLPATWLIRFDALESNKIVEMLKERTSDEKGLFLEITPTWTNQAGVKYRESVTWHSAGSAFLTGYEREERKRLVDSAFEKFKTTFNYYPSSVGAWWIDSYSLGYMKDKYKISSALIVSDQYSTDNYQIWGQYFSTPYYPVKSNALHPAQTLDNKLDVVMMQWALRDPVNSYGNGVSESTYSVQANDYIDYHDLDINYFSRLIDTYITQRFNQFSHIVVGLENSYQWDKYSEEYQKQMEVLVQKKKNGQVTIVTMKSFADWYKSTFPTISPTQFIFADDPLGSYRKAVWFMDPYFRVALFVNEQGIVFRDIRQYIEGEEELCFKTRCDSVNFATSATRVLDDVSFGQKWLIDQGKASEFRLKKEGDNFILSYKNEAGNLREISFLPRDIGIDGKIFSIDAAILNAIKSDQVSVVSPFIGDQQIKLLPQPFVARISLFVVFLTIAVTIPGIVLTKKLFDKDSAILLRLLVSTVVGLVILTLLFYLTSLMKIRQLIFAYFLISLLLFVKFKYYQLIEINKIRLKEKLDLLIILVILAGIVFQLIPTYKSSLGFNYGIGFWGPNTHDGVWHMALVSRLKESVLPENPIFAGTILKNYHYFYDLLVAVTNYLTNLPIEDLLFRLYPPLFSLMLGLGSYYLIMKLFAHKLGVIRAKMAAFFGLYLVYFAGSFGWVVEYIKQKHLGGESAFWVNQSISFNLNPPFAISLVILLTIFLLVSANYSGKSWKIIMVILLGTLTSFKSYTGLLVIAALLFLAVIEIFKKKNFSWFVITVFSMIITALLFFTNFQVNSQLIIFAPFWFVHSMIDSPDRVGWVRLSLARTSSFASENWLKFVMAETASFIIFIIGNLGLRILSFGCLLQVREVFKNNTLLVIFITVILSTIIPILFIQSGNPWNTIQFFYPALYISAIFSGIVFTLLLNLPKIIALTIISLLLILAPINSVVTASGYLNNKPHAFISTKELEGLRFLSEQKPGIVLTYPYDEKLKTKINEPWPLFVYGSSAYVSAYSNKAVFLEDEPQNQILLIDYKKRIVATKDFFFRPTSEGTKFLIDNNIKYIYIPKIFNVRLDEGIDKIKNIFENEEVIIYRFGN